MSFITSIVLLMKYYQKNNNIKGQCVTNSQYLYDNIKQNYPDKKIIAKPVIVVCNNVNYPAIIIHMVIYDEETKKIYDPSHEINSLPNTHYFDSIHSLKKSVDNITKEDMLYVIPRFLNFITLAESINNGDLVITNKEFYDKQADFIEKTYYDLSPNSSIKSKSK